MEGSRSLLPRINLEPHCEACRRGVWLLSVAEAYILSSLWRRKEAVEEGGGGEGQTHCPFTGPLPYHTAPPDTPPPSLSAAPLRGDEW